MTPSRHSTPPVRLAAVDDVPGIAATLTSAFADDPLVAWFLGGDDRSHRLVHVFRAMAASALREAGREVHVAGDGGSVAIWHDVGRWQSSPAHQLRMLPGIVRSCRWRSVLVLRTHATVERLHPETPHRYLACLGTRADAQGLGLGGAVLAPMLDRCDDEGVAVYAESSNPRNLAFYHRHGFTAGEAIVVGPDAPPIVPIWRDPR